MTIVNEERLDSSMCLESPTRAFDLDEVAVIKMIGDTPLVRLRNLAANRALPDNVEIWLKTEWTNPGGSIKDRPALSIVRQAIEADALDRGQTLLDATSGNTGIAYAMLGAAIGFPVMLVVPDSASDERKRILKAYGATVMYSDPYEGSNGAIELARKVAASDPVCFYYADQYANPANPAAHFQGTGPEIWRQSAGRITHFVAGLGTTGTLMGAGAFFKLQSSPVEIVAVQPSESFHGIEGLKHLPTAIVPAIYDASMADRQTVVDTDRAFDLTRELARTEGLFAGTSTGAALAAALEIGEELASRRESGVIVAIAPDGGGKYLSTALWS